MHTAGGRYHWMSEVFPAEDVEPAHRRASTTSSSSSTAAQAPRHRRGGPARRAAPHPRGRHLHARRPAVPRRPLDWDEKKAYVRRVDVDYYTDANLAVDLEVLESFERAPATAATSSMARSPSPDVATIFKKIKLDTHENVGWGRIAIPEAHAHHRLLARAAGGELVNRYDRDTLDGALIGLARVAQTTGALLLMCRPA